VDSGKHTILVVDDNPFVRDVVQSMLQHRGYSVITAENPKVALKLMAEHPVEAALVDVDMPVMNGVDACRALRDQAAAMGRSLLVWLMTGVTRPDLVARAVAAGAIDVIAKPFTTDELISRVEPRLEGFA
jgi:CheY-like chemotaxis protein